MVHTFFQVCTAMNHTYLFVTLASLMQFGLLQKCNQHIGRLNISCKLLLEKIDSPRITPCIPGGLIICGQHYFTSLIIVLHVINKLFGSMTSYHGLNSTCFAPYISPLKPRHCHNLLTPRMFLRFALNLSKPKISSRNIEQANLRESLSSKVMRRPIFVHSS